MSNNPKEKKTLKEFFSHLFQSNKYERHLKDLLAQIAKNPEDVRLKLDITQIYLKTKDIPNAIQTYREVTDLYLKQNFILKAVATYKNILKLAPNLVEINLILGELYTKLSMIPDAVNQYRIAMQIYGSHHDKEKQVELGHKLVELDPSPLNRRKLAEIYQAHGQSEEAVKHYEILAKTYREQKQYDDLLRVYELILPHQVENHAMIKDVCILYLRKQEPDHAIRTLERYKVQNEDQFAPLLEKAKLMKKALGNVKTKKSPS